MGIVDVHHPGFLDDLCRPFPYLAPFYSPSHKRRSGHDMYRYMESPSPTAETLRRPHAIGAYPSTDSRPRSKRAPHGRVYRLDEMLCFCDTIFNTLLYDRYAHLYETKLFTVFTDRHEQKLGYHLIRNYQRCIGFRRYFFSYCVSHLMLSQRPETREMYLLWMSVTQCLEKAWGPSASSSDMIQNTTVGVHVCGAQGCASSCAKSMR